jgi:hypothetical protein
MCAASQTVRLDEWSNSEKVLVQFRLLYSGTLLGASRSDTRASLKHEIRQELSPQLKRLWETNEHLKRFSRGHARLWHEKHPKDKEQLPTQDGPEIKAALCQHGLSHIAHNFERAGQPFIPLVTEEMGLRCKLEVLFLRPEEAGSLYVSGDLDNRIKTLFDALRIAKDAHEMAGSTPSNEPIYCLLEDDRVISEIRVNTDQLLLLPKEQVIHPNDVFLVIEVSLQAPPGSNISFTFG